MSPTGTEPLGLSLDVSAIPAQAVGVGRYVLELVDALERRDDVALTLWCRSDDATRWSQDGAPRSVRPLAPKPRPLRLLWEQTALGRLVDASGASVHHSPHYTMPERTKVPCVVTVHDLTFFDHPEWHERTKVPVFRRAVRVAARRARALMCDSEKTARRLEEVCRPEGRVVVVPLGVDLRRFNPVAGDDDEGVLASLGVRRPYVLFLGTLEPRKSVPELVGAFDVVASSRTELSLVLAGRPGWGISEIERALERARHAGRISRVGYVEDRALPALLRSAAAVAYPAKEEGFGLPALEALACGAPLVTTSGTVMAELAGPAAFTAAPGSGDELIGAIEGALDDEGDTSRREIGFERARAHSWEKSAEAHMSVYRWAAGDL